MALKTFAAGKLRVGDRFTKANIAKLAGKTVWEVDRMGGNVLLVLHDRTTVKVDAHLEVQITR